MKKRSKLRCYQRKRHNYLKRGNKKNSSFTRFTKYERKVETLYYKRSYYENFECVLYVYVYDITCEYVSWMRTCTLSLDNEDDCVGVRTRVQTSASLSRYHNLNVDILLLTLLYVIVLFICYWHFVLFQGRVIRLIVNNLSDFFFTQ